MRSLGLSGQTRLAEAHPGARLALACGACGWSRTYDPERIVQRLLVRRAGGPQTPVAEVAGFVQWNCPRCHRMRWRTELVGLER